MRPGETVLGRYVVESLIGSGGMGTVWRGRHVQLGMPVALKVLQHATRESAARFEREALLMARVRHPGVVSIFDYGPTADGTPCIAMELVEGEPLDARLKRAGALAWPEALWVLEGLLQGLSAVHAQGVLHRDLKPANVLLAGGEPPVVKLVDFGIARPVDPKLLKRTATGVIIGTLGYMSPEQLGGYVLDARADVYSAGILLYELLAGALPFEDGGIAGAYRRMVEVVPQPLPPAGLPPLPPALWDALASALRPGREERPSGTREFAALLRKAGPATPLSVALPAPQPPCAMEEPTLLRSGPVVPESAPAAQEMETAELGPGPKPRPAAALRSVVVAQLPPSRLKLAEERRWLGTQVGPGGRSLTLGAQHWLALLAFAGEEERKEALSGLRARVRARFGPTARLVSADAGPDLQLTAAHLSGASPLPSPIQRLLEELAP